MEQLLLMVIIGLFLLVNAMIKKALSSESAAGETGRKSREYKASIGDIEEFLEEKLLSQQKAPEKKAQQHSRAGQTTEIKRTDLTTLSTEKQTAQKHRKRHSPKKQQSEKTDIAPDNAKRRELTFTTKDMQHAVIMSEIFRPPVALRGNAGHIPPFLRK
jgi:DNA primase